MAQESTGPTLSSPNPPPTVHDDPSLVEEAQAKASALGRSAAHRADRARARTAAGLESAAGSVHDAADRAASVGHSAGDALADSAQYVRDHDVRDMVDDLLDVVRNNPGIALLGAAAFGFLVGRVITRD